MTIDKAIERLQEDIDSTGTDEMDTLTEAEMLGIEALDQLKREREQKVGFWRDRLPGETEE